MRPRTLQSGKHYQQVEAWYIQRGKHNNYFESDDMRRKENSEEKYELFHIRSPRQKLLIILFLTDRVTYKTY